MTKVVSLVKKYLKEKRGNPLNVTVPEAQLLHDFATWVDENAAQHRAHHDAGDSTASRSRVHASAKPKSRKVAKRTQRG